MRYTTDIGSDPGLGWVGDGGLGIVVRPGGGGFRSGFRPTNFVFRSWAWPSVYPYPYPYNYFYPAYQYGDASCPVALALTPEQTAAVRAGQAVSVSAQNQCGQMVSVTVQGTAPLPPPSPPGASSVSGLGLFSPSTSYFTSMPAFVMPTFQPMAVPPRPQEPARVYATAESKFKSDCWDAKGSVKVVFGRQGGTKTVTCSVGYGAVSSRFDANGRVIG